MASVNIPLSTSNPTLILHADANSQDLCPTLRFQLDDSTEYSVKLNRSLSNALDNFDTSGVYIRTLIQGAYTSSPPSGASGDNTTFFVIPVANGALTFRVICNDLKILLNRLRGALKPKTRTQPGWYRVDINGLRLLPSGKYEINNYECGAIPSNNLGRDGWYATASTKTIMVYLTPTNHVLV